jgi:hypothetical protein
MNIFENTLRNPAMSTKSICYLILSLLISTGTLVSARDNQDSSVKTKKAKPIPVESFKHSDIGNPAIAGTVKISGDGFDITAGGADIWGIKDEFNFVYVERTGDFDIVTRIESLSAPHQYTKAGLMAREDLTPGSRHIYFQVFPDNKPRNKNNGGYEFQYRQQKDGEMKAIYPKSAVGTPEFPVSYPNTWVRLQRVKNDFTGYYSTDGRNWKVYTTYSLELPAKIYLGLAVTSHNKSESVSARFSDTGEIKR